MTSCLRFLSLILLGFFVQTLAAQNGTYPWGIGAGARYLAYQAHLGQAKLGTSQYSPVGTILLGRYLNSAFDFRTQLNVGPSVQFPVAEGGFEQTWMVDMSYLMVFKLHNDLILPESFPVSPYFMAGLGGSYVPNHPDAFFPVGAGLRVRFNSRMSLNLETTRQISLNGDFQHLAHAISFVYNLGPKPEEEPVEEEEDEDPFVIMDTDGDGVADDEDLCPDEFGTIALQGCPEYEPEEEPFVDSSAISSGGVTDPTDNGYGSEYNPNEFDFTQPDNDPADMSDPNGPCIALTKETLPVLYFDNGSDEMGTEARQTLDAIAAKMKDCDQLKLVLKGYTSDMGNERDNKVLAVMRAYRVKYYLVYEHGISQVRITSNGLSGSGDGPRGRRVDMELAF